MTVNPSRVTFGQAQILQHDKRIAFADDTESRRDHQYTLGVRERMALSRSAGWMWLFSVLVALSRKRTT
jgi:hypothetical protein